MDKTEPATPKFTQKAGKNKLVFKTSTGKLYAMGEDGRTYTSNIGPTVIINGKMRTMP